MKTGDKSQVKALIETGEKFKCRIVAFLIDVLYLEYQA